MDDVVLNVRQIAQYPEGQALPGDWVVFQQTGPGGPYASSTIQDLVAAGGGAAAPSALPYASDPNQLFTGTLSLANGGLAFNAYYDAAGQGRYRRTGPAAIFEYDESAGALALDFMVRGLQDQAIVGGGGRMQFNPDGSFVANRVLLTNQGQSAADVVTVGWINTQGVRSFNGRFGPIKLNRDDILLAGGAAAYDTELEGTPLAPTADGSCKHQIANVECVEYRVAQWINGLINEHPFVFTFNDRRGDVWLRAEDITEASFRDPNEVPQVPTAPDGTATDQIASTAFVMQGLQDLQDWVENELATSGDVTMAYLQANYAPLFNPNLVGIPQAPTANPGTSTGQIATTAFVMNAVQDSTTGVASFNTRTGHIVLETVDVIDAGGAPLASPTFTGTPQAPTPAPGNSSTQIATTAFVAASSVVSFNGRQGVVVLSQADITGAGGAPIVSPAFSSVPTAPTAPPGTNTPQLATTAFVQAAVAASTAGVAAFNGRTGDVTLLSSDISAAGGATVASPTFTGTPTAPTAVPGTSNGQIATTAFVQNALSTGNVASFNGRTGAVELTAADVTAVIGTPLPLSGGTMTGPLVLAGAGAAASNQAVTVNQLAGNLANYLPLTGGTLTGNLAVSGTSAFNGQAVFSNAYAQFNGGMQIWAPGWNASSGNAILQLINVVLRSDSYYGFLGATPNSFASNAAGYTWGLGCVGQTGASFHRADLTSQWLCGFLWGTSQLLTGIGTNGSTIVYNTGSDRRMKDNIHDLDDDVDVGEMIDAMRPVAFNWRHLTGIVNEPGKCLMSPEAERRDRLKIGEGKIRHGPVGKGTKIGHGFIAQDMIKIAPHAVSAPNDGEGPLLPYDHGAEYDELNRSMPWGIDYGKLVPYLVAELKNLRRRVAALEG